MQRSFKAWHFIVREQEDINRLTAFCINRRVKQYAYIKHKPDNDKGYVHYHFYFVLHRKLDAFKMEELTGVKCINSNYVLSSNKEMLRYLVRGSLSLKVVPPKDVLVTNIRINRKVVYGV